MLEDAQIAAKRQADFLSAMAAAPISVAYSSAVGAAMVCSSAFIAAINITVIKTLLSAKELYKLSSYKFIIGIGAGSIVQLSVQFVAGVLTIMRTNGGAVFNRVHILRLISACIFAVYIFYILLTLVLASNRLTIVISPFTERWLFGKIGVRVWLTVCTVVTIVYFAFLMSPIMGVFYDWHILSFDCLLSLPSSNSLVYYKSLIERSGSYAITVIYLLIFLIIKFQRKRVNLEGRNRRGTVDSKILIQSFAIAADCLILNVFWFYCEDYLPLIFSNEIDGLVFLNFLWIFSCAVNPIVYFLLNSSVRKKIMEKSISAPNNRQKSKLFSSHVITVVAPLPDKFVSYIYRIKPPTADDTTPNDVLERRNKY